MQNLIADFYRVCLFGTKDPDIEDAAKRAYRDLCRTLKLNKGENGISHRDNVISEIIELRIKEKLVNSVYMSQGDYDEFHHALCKEIILWKLRMCELCNPEFFFDKLHLTSPDKKLGCAT